jgi:hypothetical protein
MSKKQPSSEKSPATTDKVSGPPFTIRMGLPHMDDLWKALTAKSDKGKLTGSKRKLYKKWGKALRLLSTNPFYPGLCSHEITSLTKKYGNKIFESYLENKTSGAARMFWTYGPGRAEITILALEPHPEPGEYASPTLPSSHDFCLKV